MKLCVTSLGQSLEDAVDPRFGRCQYFTFITIIKGQIKAVKVVPNISSMEKGGLGIQAVEIVTSNKASKIITRSLGYNAFDKLNSLNIKIFKAPDERETVKNLIKSYLEGNLQQFSSTDIKAKYGNT